MVEESSALSVSMDDTLDKSGISIPFHISMNSSLASIRHLVHVSSTFLCPCDHYGQGRINKFSVLVQIIEGAHDHPPETIAWISHLTLSQPRH